MAVTESGMPSAAMGPQLLWISWLLLGPLTYRALSGFFDRGKIDRHESQILS